MKGHLLRPAMTSVKDVHASNDVTAQQEVGSDIRADFSLLVVFFFISFIRFRFFAERKFL